MSERERILDELRAAELERQRAIAEHRWRADVVRELIREGREAGVPMSHMAEASGITRENLYQMIGPIGEG